MARSVRGGAGPAAGQYEEWKLAHAAAKEGGSPYSASKTPFVAAVLATRGIVVKPDEERLEASRRVKG